MRVALAGLCACLLLSCSKKPRPETLHEPVVLPITVDAARKLDAGQVATAPAPDAAAARSISSEPDDHRAQAAACSGEAKKGDARAGVPGCKSDHDCKDGPGFSNGRCIHHPGGHSLPRNECVWDGCFADQDCGKGACVCGAGIVGNHCLGGNCATDAECGAGGFCSSSRNDQQSCFGAGPVGWFCHTAKDECMKREDCKGSREDCVFSPGVAHWICKDIYSHCPVG